jgi:hypothetical protein
VLSTDKSGQSTNGGVYGPQEIVKIRALVTYNLAPVVNKQVAFAVVSPNGTIHSVTTALTNQTGYALWEFRLPWPDSNPQSLFGNWTIVATVDISQATITSSIQFAFNYIININGIQMSASVHRSQTTNINITVQSIANTPSVLTVTICDEQKVPIAFVTKSLSSTPAGGPVTATVNLTIPSWAFVGTATVYVNLLTSLPTSGGVPLCPEKTANFQIIT